MNTKFAEPADNTARTPGARSAPGRSDLVIVLILFDGTIKFVPWLIAAEMMRRMGCGSSESLVRSRGVIGLACTVFHATPPTSLVGAILMAGRLGGAFIHARPDGPLFTYLLFGSYLGVVTWGWLSLRTRGICPLCRQSWAS